MEIDHAVVLAEAAPLIGYAVRMLVRSGFFTAEDRGDLRQELLLAVFQRLPQYDPEVCVLPAFLTTVIRSRARNLFRERKVRAGTVAMLTSGDLDWLDFGGDRRKLVSPPADLALDVESVLITLSPWLCQIASLLMVKTPAEVARELHLTRHAVRKAIRQLDRHFRTLLGTGCPKMEPTFRAPPG